MASWWPFRRREPEKRASASGFTAEVMAARESYIAGRRGLAELTATVQGCVSLWESGFAIADVRGTDLLTRRNMAVLARSLALRGEAVFLIRGDGLLPAADWDLSTRNGVPRAYRLSISEAGGGTSMTALAGEVLHVRIGADPVAPWLGSAPLRRASLTASMLHAVESALSEVYEYAPLGSLVLPLPEMPEQDMTNMARSFQGQRGRVLLRESVTVSAAGGPAPATDWAPRGLSPDLEKAMTAETLAAARDSISAAFFVLPSLLNPQAQGPVIREGQRHLCAWGLQPIAELVAEEASAKLGNTVAIDCLRPLQAFDQGSAARAVATLVSAAAEAKAAGLDDATVAAIFARMDWES